MAGINGDFFNTSNGLPIGILVSEGEVLSSDGGYYAMGFREDGSAVIGKPGLSISANLGYQGSDSSGYFTDIIRTVAGINKARVSTGGIYLYTYDFNNRHTTGNTEAGVDVLCTIVDGSLSIGGTMTLVVDQVIEATSQRPSGRTRLSSPPTPSPTPTTPTPCGTSLWAHGDRQPSPPPMRRGTMCSTPWVPYTPGAGWRRVPNAAARELPGC